MAPIRSRLEFWGQFAGLCATGWVVWVTSVGPHWAHRDLQPRLFATAAITFYVLCWSALLGLALRFVIRSLIPEETAPPSAAVAIWYAPATILILQFSLVGMASGLALVVSATRLLCPPRTKPAAAGRFARYFYLSIIVSAAFQAAVVAFAMGRRLPTALLLAASAAMLAALATGVGAWTQDRPPDLPRSIMALAVTVLLALVLGRGAGRGSGWGLGMGPDWTISFHAGSGSVDDEAPALPLAKPVSVASMPKRADDWPTVRPIAAADAPGMFPGVILWPEIKPVTTLVAPSLARGIGLGSPPRPMTIPFAGEYWLFRWPYLRPPPNSYFQRGTPSALFFSSTDRIPLQMEAHHKLERAISMRCCRRMEIAIRNADRHPGTILLELFLIDSKQPNARQSLGRAPVNSVPDLRADRPQPVPETLDFHFPSAPRLDEFDEIKLIFRRAVQRMDKSARISIEKFVLTPVD